MRIWPTSRWNGMQLDRSWNPRHQTVPEAPDGCWIQFREDNKARQRKQCYKLQQTTVCPNDATDVRAVSCKPFRCHGQQNKQLQKPLWTSPQRNLLPVPDLCNVHHVIKSATDVRRRDTWDIDKVFRVFLKFSGFFWHCFAFTEFLFPSSASYIIWEQYMQTLKP